MVGVKHSKLFCPHLLGLHLPSAEGTASFRKDSVLSPEFAPVETPEALGDLRNQEALCLTRCRFLRQTFHASLSLEQLHVT